MNGTSSNRTKRIKVAMPKIKSIKSTMLRNLRTISKRKKTRKEKQEGFFILRAQDVLVLIMNSIMVLKHVNNVWFVFIVCAMFPNRNAYARIATWKNIIWIKRRRTINAQSAHWRTSSQDPFRNKIKIIISMYFACWWIIYGKFKMEKWYTSMIKKNPNGNVVLFVII